MRISLLVLLLIVGRGLASSILHKESCVANAMLELSPEGLKTFQKVTAINFAELRSKFAHELLSRKFNMITKLHHMAHDKKTFHQIHQSYQSTHEIFNQKILH